MVDFTSSVSFDQIFQVASCIGIIAFALSGVLLAARKHFDVVGTFVLSLLTATGGGAIRDIMVNRTPNLLKDPLLVYVTLATLFFSLLFKLHHKSNLEKKWLFVASDAVGLAAFTITGTLVGLEVNLGLFGVMLLGLITAVGGGVLRDILVNDVPFILKGDFYASVALFISLSLYILHHYQALSSINIGIIGIIGTSMRLIAYAKNWRLPQL
ncbi:MAG: trimeric intracellular cation channel family protein [Burkholderiales bacterium]